MGLEVDGGIRIGVLIVRNDTSLFTEVLAEALASERDVRLLSRPLAVDEALDFCFRNHPDVVLVEASETSDASLPGLVRSITSPVVLLADALIDDALLVAGVEAGAYGVVDGETGIGAVLRAVRAAATGRRLVDPERFLRAVEGPARASKVERDLAERVDRLTDREREVLACLAEGLRNTEIANAALDQPAHGGQARSAHPPEDPSPLPSPRDDARST